LLIHSDCPLMESCGLRHLHHDSHWAVPRTTDRPHRVRPGCGMSVRILRFSMDSGFPRAVNAIQRCKASILGEDRSERLSSQFIFGFASQPAKGRIDVIQDVIGPRQCSRRQGRTVKDRCSTSQVPDQGRGWPRDRQMFSYV
jgi:hypothetical protein